jgi:hypothetical protein
MKKFRKTNKKNKSKIIIKKTKNKRTIKKRLFRGGTLGFKLKDKDDHDIKIDDTYFNETYFEDGTTYYQLRAGLSRAFNNLSTDHIILKPSPSYLKLKEPDYETVIPNSIAIIKVETTEPSDDKIAKGMSNISFNPHEATKSNNKPPEITPPGWEIFEGWIIFSDVFWNTNIRVYDKIRYATDDRKHLDLSKLEKRTKIHFVRFVDEKGIIRIFEGVYGGNDENGHYFKIIRYI